MSHPPIFILGYSEASMLLRKEDAADIGAVISIHGQGEYPVEAEGIPHRLVLRFDDTEAPNPTDPIHAARVRMRQGEAAEMGLRLTPPTPDQARSIIEFAHSIRETDAALLCQCLGGVSRSPAAALLCLATWSGPGQERRCVEKLLSARPCAVPHRDLVSFGDTQLQRGGKLMEALQRAQR